MNNLINKCSVIDKIVNVMVDKLKINPNYLIEKNYDKPLTGPFFDLQATDMTYLFFEIEKNFNIKIMPHDILDEQFNTVKGIAEVIIKYNSKEVSL